MQTNTYGVFIIQNYGLRFSHHYYWQGRLTKDSIHYLSSLNVWDNQWKTVWRNLWYSIGKMSYYSCWSWNIIARGSLTKLPIFCSVTHWFRKRNNSGLRQMEMKTDRLFESQLDFGGCLSKKIHIWDSLHEYLLYQRMHHEKWG